MIDNMIMAGDVMDKLKELPDGSIDCVVTSPPYWGLRDYGCPGQIGLEKTPEEYVAKMVAVFREVRRVLKDEGTLWLNLGDSYVGGGRGGQSEEKRSENGQPVYGNPGLVPSGMKAKDMVGIPWRVAFALQADGWYLRSDIIWAKPNPMPESVTDRPTKSHEYIFLLSKKPHYFFDQEAVREKAVTDEDRPFGIIRDRIYDYDSKEKMIRPRTRKVGEGQDSEIGRKGCCGDNGSRNIRSVWTITTQPYPEAHFATFPEALPERCIKAGCPKGGIVLDPFCGSGTTLRVAQDLGRRWIGIELKPEYITLAYKRIRSGATPLNGFMKEANR